MPSNEMIIGGACGCHARGFAPAPLAGCGTPRPPHPLRRRHGRCVFSGAAHCRAPYPKASVFHGIVWGSGLVAWFGGGAGWARWSLWSGLGLPPVPSGSLIFTYFQAFFIYELPYFIDVWALFVCIELAIFLLFSDIFRNFGVQFKIVFNPSRTPSKERVRIFEMLYKNGLYCGTYSVVFCVCYSARVLRRAHCQGIRKYTLKDWRL